MTTNLSSCGQSVCVPRSEQPIKSVYNSILSTFERMWVIKQQDAMAEKSPKLLATPLQSRSSMAKFSLPTADYSSSSSSSSASSLTTFWTSPRTPSYWSPRRYIPAKVRSTMTKRQVAVLSCLALALLVWVAPPPSAWRRRVVDVTSPQPVASPYQVLQPLSPLPIHKGTPSPLKWLEKNSNNKYAITAGSKLSSSVVPHLSQKPRAALISLVRNSELPGLMQSMRQLEYHWNRKYRYPWVFFNDEPFSDEFKVGRLEPGCWIF